MKETKRQFQLDRIYQGIICLSIENLPTEIIKPVVTLTVWQFSFDKIKLFPYSMPQTAGLRRMTSKDISSLIVLFNNYTLQFEIGQTIQSEEECSLLFLPKQNELDDALISVITYVVEDPISGDITDMFSFRCSTDTVSNTFAVVTAIVQTKTPPKQLIIDLLVYAKQEKVLHISLDLNVKFLRKYLMPRQTFVLPLFMYNYSYPEVDEDNFYFVLL